MAFFTTRPIVPGLFMGAVVAAIAWLVPPNSSSQVIGQTIEAPEVASDSESSESADADKIASAIDDLDHSKFRVRQEAFRYLINGGISVIGPLEQAARTGDLETGSRCVEALIKIAADDDLLPTVLASLERLADDPDPRVVNLAAGPLKKMKMTDEDRAVAALTAAGVRIFRAQNQRVFSVSISRDRESVWLRHLPTLHSVTFDGEKVTDAAITQLIHAKQVTDVSLMRTSVTAAGVALLDDVDALESVSFAGASLSEETIRSFRHVAGIKRLSLHDPIDDSHLRALAAVRQLDSLFLSEVKFSETSAHLLNQLDHLQSLSFTLRGANDQHCQWVGGIKVPLRLSVYRSPAITAAGWKALAKAPIRALSMSSTPIDDEGLVHVGTLKGLRTLYVTEAPITDDGLVHLEGLNSLQGLVLRGTKVTEGRVAKLKTAIPSLRYVRVEKVQANPRLMALKKPAVNFRTSSATGKKNAHVRHELTDEVFEEIKAEPDVHTLFLSRVGLDDQGLKRVATLPIKGIFAVSDIMTDAGIAHLKSHATIESLYLTGARLSDQSLEAIGTIPSLDQLTLNNATLSDASVQRLIARLSERGKIRRIGIHQCHGLTSAAFRSVGTLESLEKLFVTETVGIDHKVLTFFGECEGLTQLRVGGLLLDADGVSELKGLPLEHFHCTNSQIGDDALQEFVASFPQLRQLGLAGTNVTDESMTEVGKLKELQWLWINDTQVSDVGLSKLSGLEDLKYVHAKGSNVSEYGGERLKDSLPDVKVELRF